MQVKIKHNSYSNADAFIGGMLIGAGLGVLAASINNHNSSLDDIRSLEALHSEGYIANIDFINIQHDWENVGGYIRNSLEHFEVPNTTGRFDEI